MPRRKFALALALLSSQTVWADLTIRYQFEVKFGPGFPAAAAEEARRRIETALPNKIAMQIKGDKCANSAGPLSAIVDAGKDEITLFSPAIKQFATAPRPEYERWLARQQVLAAGQQALQSMKLDLQTKKTGETGVIQGIRIEDNLIVLSMEGRNAAGVATPFRVEVHEWLASASELGRIPALSGMAGCSQGAESSNPEAILQTILGQMPGATAKIGDAMNELTKPRGTLALKVQVEFFAPAADAKAPLMEMNLNLAELSTDPLPDTMFQVPEGYQSARLEDLLKAATGSGPAQARAQAAGAPAAPIEDFKGPAYRPGGGVSNPVPVDHPEPQYTEEARHARIEGAVLLSLVVDENGVTRNIKVARSLDPGLDQSAIDAVRQWKFKPGQKDGHPVAVAARIEVTFRLLDKPPDQ